MRSDAELCTSIHAAPMMRRLLSRAAVLTGVTVIVSGVSGASDTAAAQDASVAALQEERPRGGWATLWSRRTPHDRVILGMVTAHVFNWSRPLDQNNALGLVYEGVLGASFITTHGPRGYVVAFERSWFEGRWGPFDTMFGFRTGLVGGYDDRFADLAGRVPVLPYAQPIGVLRWADVSLDLTYTWVVMSLAVGVTLW
jgi:hypothetical protein